VEWPIVKVIVGLGNPGRAYTHTRHNVGFDTLDLLARRRNTRIVSRRGRALVARFEHDGEEVLLVKPQTFMNDSGSAVGHIAHKHQLKPEDVIVVCDDIDLPLGRLRIRRQGSSGGHKGMQSIINHLHSNEFARIRIGVGRQGDAIGHVLSRFGKKEKEAIEIALQRAADALEMILTAGLDPAMNEYNRAEPEE
jgi:PTH1 family peptidyl-tRNA hydrolase